MWQPSSRASSITSGDEVIVLDAVVANIAEPDVPDHEVVGMRARPDAVPDVVDPNAVEHEAVKRFIAAEGEGGAVALGVKLRPARRDRVAAFDQAADEAGILPAAGDAHGVRRARGRVGLKPPPCAARIERRVIRRREPVELLETVVAGKVDHLGCVAQTWQRLALLSGKRRRQREPACT